MAIDRCIQQGPGEPGGVRGAWPLFERAERRLVPETPSATPASAGSDRTEMALLTLISQMASTGDGRERVERLLTCDRSQLLPFMNYDIASYSVAIERAKQV